MSSSPGSPKPLVDASERRLAESDLSTNYWVEAGAGTGKTTLLIRRLLHIIVQGAARLEEVAAITFTEKAAAELKARLRDELEKQAYGAAAEKLARIRGALEELETAPITTIHSFAGLLLRERPVEAAVDPRFEIYEPGEMDDLLDEVWENWFFPELASGSEMLTRALTLGISPGRLRELGSLLYHQRDLVAEGSTPEPPDLFPSFCDFLTTSLPELKSLPSSCRQLEDKGLKHILEIVASAERLLSFSSRLERERYFLQDFPTITARGNQKNWDPPAHCKRQKEICVDLRQAQEAARLSLKGQLTADLVHWCGGYLDSVEQAKEEAGVLDFQDLLIKARDLLRDSKEVRGYFQRRFRYLLVDEFQDTDPLQVDLVFLLAEKTPRAACWQEAEPAEGKLFLVGDPKQSIYRFRRADIEIYQAARQNMLRNGQALAIKQNFRTLPEIIEWVNHAFSILIEPCGNFQPEYQPLSAFRPPRGEPSVVLLNPDLPLDGAKADDIRAAEAAAVARLIEDAVSKWRLPAGDGSVRPLKYGDIALLFPTTTGIYHFEEALRAQKIPYRLEGGRRFYLREEIAFLKNLLTAVSNPFDQIALVAVLRYWAGIPDEMLFHYMESGGKLNYLADVAADFPPLQQAFHLLRRAHAERQKTSIAGLIESLFEEAWFWQRVALRPQGRRIAGNLRKALQMIRLLEIERPLTLRGYVAWLDRIAEQDREEAESSIHDPGSDSVRLLTIHKSKGLEFPVVCLMNMGGQSRWGTPFMADRSRNLFYIKLGDFISAGVDEAEKQETLRLEAEQIRLFYVAATRARDFLILPRFYKSGKRGFWSYLEKVEGERDDLWSGTLSLKAVTLDSPDEGVEDDSGALPDQAAGAMLDHLIARREDWRREQAEVISAAAVSGPYISAGKLAGLEAEFAEGAEEDRVWAPGERAPDIAEEGTAFGSAFHQIMEQADLRCPSYARTAADIDLAAEHWGIENPAELACLVQKTLEHPLLLRAHRAKRIFKELPFSYSFEGLLIEGIVDLLFEEKEGLVIVDYKTDAVSRAELESRWRAYRRQGSIYAAAMADISGQAVKEVSFIFVRKGLVRSIYEPDPAQLHKEIRQYIKR